MKIKNKIIKLLGGYTNEEYDKLSKDYVDLERKYETEHYIYIPKITNEEKRVHTIH